MRLRSSSDQSPPTSSSAAGRESGARSSTDAGRPAERAATTRASATAPGRLPTTIRCATAGGRRTSVSSSSRESGSAQCTSSSTRPRTAPATRAGPPRCGRAASEPRRHHRGRPRDLEVPHGTAPTARRSPARSPDPGWVRGDAAAPTRPAGPSRQVFPMPASPRTTTSRRSPAATASRAVSSSAISASRPTICTSRASHPVLQGTGKSPMFDGRRRCERRTNETRRPGGRHEQHRHHHRHPRQPGPGPRPGPQRVHLRASAIALYSGDIEGSWRTGPPNPATPWRTRSTGSRP